MKNLNMLIMLAVLVLLISACVVKPATPAETAAPQAYPMLEGYPAPVNAYPANLAESAGLYPFYSEGSQIPWEHAAALVMNGEVSQVVQAHDKSLTLTLKDGRTLMAMQPAIDEIMRVIEACGDPCKSILVATE